MRSGVDWLTKAACGFDSRPQSLTTIRVSPEREADQESAGGPGLLRAIRGVFRTVLQRSAVRNMERAGLSRSVAMQLTGHKSEAVYRRYAITSESDLREWVVQTEWITKPKDFEPSAVRVSTIVKVIILAIVCVLTCYVRTGATSAVVAQSADSVFIGVDSLRTYGGGIAQGTVCKVRHVAGVFAVAAGLGQEPATEFDVDKFIEAGARATGTLQERMGVLARRMIPVLVTTAEHVRTSDPTRWVRYQDNAFVEVALAVVENGVPSVVGRMFIPRIDVKGQIRIEEASNCLGTCDENDFLTLGHKAAIHERVKSQPTFLNRDPLSVIRDMIELESAAVPASVGRPINILRIDASGARWLQGGEVCGAF